MLQSLEVELITRRFNVMFSHRGDRPQNVIMSEEKGHICNGSGHGY